MSMKTNTPIEHLFVPAEIAMKLKEKKFNLPCIKYIYHDEKFLDFNGESCVSPHHAEDFNQKEQHTSIPMYSQVIDWLREKEIKVIECAQGGWKVWTPMKDGKAWHSHEYRAELDYAIKTALKHVHA